MDNLLFVTALITFSAVTGSCAVPYGKHAIIYAVLEYFPKFRLRKGVILIIFGEKILWRIKTNIPNKKGVYEIIRQGDVNISTDLSSPCII